jgi:stage V sporulation protein D (sporulation-specific penicillin-binding protein)
MRGSAVIRIRVITGVVMALALVLVGRLYYIQVMAAEYYKEKGERQYVHTAKDLYNRGSIFFTAKDGELVSAATIRSGYLLAINPQLIEDPVTVYEAINPIVPHDREDFITRASNKERVYDEINLRITEEQAVAIGKLKKSGVHVYKNQWRYYPGDDTASQVIGFVGYQGDELAGRYGLERYYNDMLRRDDEKLSVNFFAEMFSNLGEVMFDNTVGKRGDIVTTIEPTVARHLQNRLQGVQEEWKSNFTGGIIMNPKTGEIYAMSMVPTFDLNDRTDVPIETFKNPLVEDFYEMGSIVKPLTVAAGIDSGAISAGTTYYDAGYIDLDTFTIKNYDGKGRGTVDMQQVLNQSLNTGVSFIVDTMGKNRFRDYFKKFDFGTETGIDLPGEVYGLIDNLDSPRDVEYATASFGQGIAMTPIAMTRALATLGNGGVLVTPHIAKEFRYLDTTTLPIQYPEGERIFTEETSEEISRMLTNVVDDALMGGTVSLPNHSVAAKTGTAQIADLQNGGYYEDKYLHSFFGYFPSYDPQFIVFLYTVEPKGVRYASETLTLPFMDITQFLINYYSIPPDR